MAGTIVVSDEKQCKRQWGKDGEGEEVGRGGGRGRAGGGGGGAWNFFEFVEEDRKQAASLG